MKRRPAPVLVLAALAFPTAAQSQVRVLSTTVVPVRPYVGDIVECSIVFDPGNLNPEQGPVSLSPAVSRDAEVELVEAYVQRKSGQWICTARFVAWTPGPVRLPLAASGFSFPNVVVDVASILEEQGRDPPRYKDPMEMRGTRLMVWSFAGAFLTSAVLAGSLAFGLLPWLRRMRRAWREGRAGRDFGRSLDYLERNASSLRTDELWALLVKSLRLYMSVRTGFPYQAYTAREARAASPESLPPEAAAETATLLSEGDDVRFARKSSVGGVSGAISRSRGILKRVEEAARDGVR